MRKGYVFLFGVLSILTAFTTSYLIAQDTPKLEFEKFTLDNGLNIILHEDHSTPIVTVNIWYHVGSKNEKVGRTGFAHLFEHMMFQGSKHQPGEYFEPIQKVGGSANGSTSEDRTNYWENVPSNYLEMALWLEADRMGFLLPAMTQEKLDNQRDVVKNERRQGMDNQPYYRSSEYLLEALYPSHHPYSWTVIGSMEDLTNASKEDVEEFFKIYYAPNNASLCIAGDIDPVHAKKLVEKYFSDIPPGPPITRLQTWVPNLEEEKRLVMEDRVSLPRVYMAWHTPPLYAPDDAELDILASILSSGKTSRLYKSLVYDKQIAQEIWAYQASNEIGSTFRVVATAKPGHTLEEMEIAIDEELEKIKSAPPAEKEVTEAKNSYEASFIRGIQRVGGFGGKADLLNRYNTYLGDPGYLEKDIARYRGVTAADVQRVAKKYLDSNQRVVLHVVPFGERKEKETDVDRSTQPSESTPPALNLPDFKKKTLSNGLQVIIAENHELPLIDMYLVVNAGWAADPKGKPGVASLTSELQDEGTTSRSALEISRELKNIGAYISTDSFFDASYVSMNTLKKHLQKALDLYADVIMNPTFPPEELERKRSIYIGRVKKERMEPFTSAIKVFQKVLYGEDHPYSQPYTGSGTEESIKAITAQDLKKFYETYHRPNNAALVVVGDITEGEIIPKLEAAFKGWKKKETPKVVIPEANPIEKSKVFLVNKPGAPQSVIVYGHLGIQRNTPDYYKILTMNNLLGGKFTSRLNLNLREDKGYTYGTRSMFLESKGIGPFLVLAPVHTEYTKEALVEIMKELNGIQGEIPITDEEAMDSRNNLTMGYAAGFETSGQLAGKLAGMVQYNLPDDTFEKYIPSVKLVTKKDMEAIAGKYIHPDKSLVVIVGDVAVIEPVVKELNIGEVAYLDAEGNPVSK